MIFYKKGQDSKQFNIFWFALVLTIVCCLLFGCTTEDPLCPDVNCTITNIDDPSYLWTAQLNYCEKFDQGIEALTRIDGVVGTGIWLDGEMQGTNGEYECICY